MLPSSPAETNKYLGVLLRVGVFAFIALAGYFLFPIILLFFLGDNVPLVIATLTSFAAASVANVIALRIYERGQLADIGLGWTAPSRRNLLIGAAGGAGAGLLVLAGPVLVRAADLAPIPDEAFHWPNLLFVTLILLFGAVGEEMLFRGYAFQILVRAIGPFATILPMAVLFGLAHSPNANFTWIALINTFLWGVIFGYAFIRSGDLWLPIGLHFGWNFALPLFGANLSGFTMGVTGYSVRWKIGDLWSGGAYGPEGGVLATATVVALFFFLQRAPIEHQDAFLLRETSS
ncbi:MAG TPA: CPBP family intramembrane glutamic endopeptidase [Bryobacteraceae bacterium]|nr:CPBP family intramembrane glutamic endopeptidase [Bryobacteraceae bacterium]